MTTRNGQDYSKTTSQKTNHQQLDKMEKISLDIARYKYSVYTDGTAIDDRVGAAAVLSMDRTIHKTL